MTSYGDDLRGAKPEIGEFHGFHHCEFWVSNAKQSAKYFVNCMGFKEIAYKGLETGSREYCSHVVRQGKVTFVFTSSYKPDRSCEINQHVAFHGDGVKDVAFEVKDAEGIYKKAIERGAVSAKEPSVHTETVDIKDADGNAVGTEEATVTTASVRTYGDTIHTLIEKSDNYKGVFMPGFEAPRSSPSESEEKAPEVGLDFIDHCVGNQPDGKMVEVANWYENVLDFHRFWSVDDKQIHTEYSALRSIVMTDYDKQVKMPINEPAEGKKKSQIQEFVDYYGGAGVQHIALNTRDVIKAVTALKSRGQEFLTIPKAYYTDLRERLSNSSVKVQESLDILESLNILVDFDEGGYLLQIFTKNIQDRPTVFLEIIQRENFDGFGAGNFKSLFESIEIDQDARGNLTDLAKEAVDQAKEELENKTSEE